MAIDLASQSVNNFLKGLEVFNKGMELYQKGLQEEAKLQQKKTQLDIVNMFNQTNTQLTKQRDMALGLAKTDEQRTAISKQFSKQINDSILQFSGKLTEAGTDPAVVANLFKMEKLVDVEEKRTLEDQISAGIAKGIGLEQAKNKLEQQQLEKQLPEGMSVRKGAVINKEDVKKVKETKEFINDYIKGLDKLKSLIETHGSERWGEAAGDMSTIRTNLIGLAKGEGDLNLGVLTGPDMEVVSGKIPDPLSLTSNIATMIPFSGSKARMIKQLETAKKELIQKAKLRLGAANVTGDIFSQPNQKRIGNGAFTPVK